MVRVLIGVLGILTVLWVLHFLRRTVAGWISFLQGETAKTVWPGAAGSPEPRTVSRELKKDPQCGTYVSPELSIRSRYRGKELHFCSRACEEKFFQVQSEKSA